MLTQERLMSCGHYETHNASTDGQRKLRRVCQKCYDHDWEEIHRLLAEIDRLRRFVGERQHVD